MPNTWIAHRKRQRDEPFVADYRPYTGGQLIAVQERRATHKKHWDQYYRNNTFNGYRDRHYILREFHELREALQQLHHCGNACKSGDAVVWMEAGCGVGNALLPILEEFGNTAGWRIVGFDISSVAIELLREKQAALPAVQREKLSVWVLDPVEEEIVVAPSPPPPPSLLSDRPLLLEDSLDFVSMIFVLCSIPVDRHITVLRRVVRCMKPGAVFFFREYCVEDYAATRFAEDRRVGKNTYMRTNGTLSHFFALNEVRELFSQVGLEVLELSVVERDVLNRKEGLNLHRKFIQGRFIKTKKNEFSKEEDTKKEKE